MNIKFSNKDFPQALKDIREMLDLERDDLAERLGRDYNYVYSLEKRRFKAPNTDTIKIIAVRGLWINPMYFKEYRYEMFCSYTQEHPEYVMEHIQKNSNIILEWYAKNPKTESEALFPEWSVSTQEIEKKKQIIKSQKIFKEKAL